MELIKTYDYSLLTLDIIMPGLDGLALCRYVRKTSEAPILFLTTMDSEQDKVLGLILGADRLEEQLALMAREDVARTILRAPSGKTNI